MDLPIILGRLNLYVAPVDLVDVFRGRQLVDRLPVAGVLEPDVVLLETCDALRALQLQGWNRPLERRRSTAMEHAGRPLRFSVLAAAENDVSSGGTGGRSVVSDGRHTCAQFDTAI